MYGCMYVMRRAPPNSWVCGPGAECGICTAPITRVSSAWVSPRLGYKTQPGSPLGKPEGTGLPATGPVRLNAAQQEA